MRTALVTGGSGGIGKACGRTLVELGYDVILTARREEPLRAAAEEMGARYVVADATVPEKFEHRPPRRTSSHVIQLAPARWMSASLPVRRHRLSSRARTTVSSTTSHSCSVDVTDAALSLLAMRAQCRSSSSTPISGAAYSSPT